MKNYLSLPFVFVFVLTSLIHPVAQRVESRFDTLLSEQFPADGPGCTALVAKDGKVIYRKAFGKANLDTRP